MLIDRMRDTETDSTTQATWSVWASGQEGIWPDWHRRGDDFVQCVWHANISSTLRLPTGPQEGSEQVFINGLLQSPELDYTIFDNTIDLLTPASGDQVDVRYVTK